MPLNISLDNSNVRGYYTYSYISSNQIIRLDIFRILRKTGKRAVSEDSEGHENVSSRANVNSSANHKLTEYFPVRRSVRRTKRCVLEEKQRSIESNVLNAVEDGLKVI